MWPTFARASLLTPLLLLVCCDRPAIDPTESLVGAKQLPPARTLSRESIQINRGLGSLAPGFLSYELRPDDTLTVTFYAKDWTTILLSERFQLAPDIATRTRHELWRFRPEHLRGVQWDILPTDCPQQPIDSTPEFTVAFIADNGQHNRIGVVYLPYSSNCSTTQGAAARNLIGSALASFPRSNVAMEFDRRVRLAKAKVKPD
jgi:hypothetical protein